MQRLHALMQRLDWLLCLLAGALTPLSLAPFDAWPLALFTVALFATVLQWHVPLSPTPRLLARKFLVLGWCFGTGLFGVGASWVYVSIHDYGYAPVWLAGLLTLVFVAGLGFVFALPFWLHGRFFAATRRALLLAFPALWLLGEWSRSWLLTGFPWLYLGYGHLQSPLAGWFPLGGVWCVSLVVAFCAAALANVFFARNKFSSVLPLAIAVLLFGSGALLRSQVWTSVNRTTPVTIGIVQPDFALEDKWNPDKREFIRQALQQQSEPLWNQQIILWPEAALGELAHQALPFLEPLEQRGRQSGTTLITGIPVMDLQRSTRAAPIFYNSIVAMGNGDGIYHKVRLVPFGEYVPLENLLRGLIRFFDLPASDFSRGPEQQELLRAGTYHAAPFICYEIVYPDLVAHNTHGADFLLTISNDSWFGHSLGPLQHLEIAQARALETGRYLVRGTNNGVSAIIADNGVIEAATDQFEQETLTGVIYPAAGDTPFMRYGVWPSLALAVLMLALCYVLRRRDQHQAITT